MRSLEELGVVKLVYVAVWLNLNFRKTFEVL